MAHRRANLFGEIEGLRLVPTLLGETVITCWEDLPAHHPHVVTDAFIAMPNHVHGQLYYPESVGTGAARSAVEPGALSAVVRSFKASVTRSIRRRDPSHTGPVWQANYYEHVVRDLRGVEFVRWYIETNPERWAQDPENPRRVGIDRADGWFAEQAAPPTAPPD